MQPMGESGMDDKPHYIVGIAASAGGLEAATALITSLPNGTAATFVLAQHMAPSHTSLMPKLIARETDLKVVEVSEDLKPEVGHIYLAPSNSDVVLEDGLLKVVEPSHGLATPKPSADRLFKSLAAEAGPLCVGVVLSGTGSDGSYGLKAIREAGGITIAQDLASAKFDGMPISAIETGCVDLVLPPQEIGARIEGIIANPSNLEQFQNEAMGGQKLSELFRLLLTETHIDFRNYKESTLRRRTQRRMVATGMREYEDYLALCRTSPEEVRELCRDFLITVTRFFRDPKHFEILGQELRDLHKHTEGPMRIWVAGCATGEEAYSIAMLAAEALESPENLNRQNVQIFATDVDEAALEIARRGTYPSTAANDIPEEIRGKYFVEQGNTITVKKRLREVIFFSRNNLVQDPPFLNLSLVSLRNVLIYFNSQLQEHVLRRIHHALQPGGLLFLGTSETVGSLQDDFQTVSDKSRLYRRLLSDRRRRPIVSLNPKPTIPLPERTLPGRANAQEQANAMFDALAKGLGGNSILVSPSHEFVRVYGDITPMIELSSTTQLDLKVSLLRSPLREEAISLCNSALRRNKLRVGLHHDWGPGSVKTEHLWMVAYPIVMPPEVGNFVLLNIQVERKPDRIPIVGADEAVDMAVHKLEEELSSTREALQMSIEELQASNIELQAQNAQLQAANEELQATNEEYETSNEELQSTNEELITVNEELQIFSDELKSSTAALSAVLHTAPAPIIVVDQSLRIINCSSQASERFDLPERLGQDTQLSAAMLPIGFPSIETLARETMAMREARSFQFQHKGEDHLIQTNPIYDEVDRLRGVTIIFATMPSQSAADDAS